MDKNAIKKYAAWARHELISRVSQKAEFYGVTAKDCGDFNADSIDGRVLSRAEKSQRQALINHVRSEGYEQAMEEVAYTWFNRFCALRYIEVNNYLPTRVRVFTNENGEFKPQIIDEAIHLELDGLDMEKVYALKEANDTDALYRYLLITQCNALNKIMPVMFQKIDDYTELLLPDYLLREGSAIEQMVTSIPEEDWTDQVQIIGWLYQYYNAEKKNEVFAALKKNVKITKENIPAATQLFTPDWIVRYMVENSLGRLWVEQELLAVSHELPDEAGRIAREKQIADKFGWKYYLPEAEQTPNVRAQLTANSQKLKAEFKIEELKVIDPCAGSGHILDYMFDVLMQIYTDYGYTTSEAVRSIVENNLYGLDIDDRAAQLAYFSVMMKARSYDRRFLTRKDGDGNPDIPQPHVYTIVESNELTRDVIDYFTNGDAKLERELNILIGALNDAKEYGSILNPPTIDFTVLNERIDEIYDDISMYKDLALNEIIPLIQTAETLSRRYHVVCTNPPYMGSSNMDAKLGEFVKKHYPDSKSDLFAVFIERCGELTAADGYQAMITQHAWMFLSSYEKLRAKLLHKDTVNMAHLGARAFEEIGGEVVQTTSFVMQNRHTDSYASTYCRLIEPTTQAGKEDIFLSGENRYTAKQDNFSKIPGSPVAYWVSEAMINLFSCNRIYNYTFSTSQNITGNNGRFVRKHWEINNDKFGCDNWIFYAKGGEYRKWWGNLIEVVNWTPEARHIYQYGDGKHASQIIKPEFWYLEGITWGIIARASFRVLPSYATFDKQGSSIFAINKEDYLPIIGFLNTKVAMRILDVLNTTLALQVRDVRNLPYNKKRISERIYEIENITKRSIFLSKSDWDAFELSWEFKKHPLLPQKRNQNLPLGMKVGEKKWIYELRNGSACFSAVNYFIEKGEKSGNNEQGDKYEGVFARVKNGDSRIEEMKYKLGEDLEIIFDGEYTMLRRKSCRNVPVFCMYGYIVNNIASNESYLEGAETYNIVINPNQKMFDCFLDNSANEDTYSMIFSVGHFQTNIEKALDKERVRYRLTQVQYDLDSEFFINPTDEYKELEHKLSRFSYQQELRIILPEMRVSDRYIVKYEPLSNKSAGVAKGKMVFKGKAHGYEKNAIRISQCFDNLEREFASRFNKLKSNEEELNRIFIDIYGLQDELTPEVEDKDVTVRKADLQREIKSLISYAVGCMFGRYSLDVDGLAYAGGEWDASKYSTYIPDKDGIIPICDDEYFEDDIVNRFVDFVSVVYGKDTLEENLKFIADALGGKGAPRQVIRDYFMNDFYADHLKIYQKRPIYWLFDSGKKNGFKCLIYIHRYKPDTIARIRTDYVHEQQARYRTAIAGLENRIANAGTGERVKLSKQLKKLQDQADELHGYEEKIHHLADRFISIDLDDGVKHNYEIFKDVLARIK